MLSEEENTLQYNEVTFQQELADMKTALAKLKDIEPVELKEQFEVWKKPILGWIIYYLFKHVLLTALGYKPEGEKGAAGGPPDWKKYIPSDESDEVEPETPGGSSGWKRFIPFLGESDEAKPKTSEPETPEPKAAEPETPKPKKPAEPETPEPETPEPKTPRLTFEQPDI